MRRSKLRTSSRFWLLGSSARMRFATDSPLRSVWLCRHPLVPWGSRLIRTGALLVRLGVAVYVRCYLTIESARVENCQVLHYCDLRSFALRAPKRTAKSSETTTIHSSSAHFSAMASVDGTRQTANGHQPLIRMWTCERDTSNEEAPDLYRRDFLLAAFHRSIREHRADPAGRRR